MDGDSDRLFPHWGRRWRHALWMVGRPHGAGESIVREHPDLLGFHRAGLLCAGTVAPGRISFYGRAWDGWGMGPRRCPGHGMLAGEMAADAGRGDWSCGK